jgi:CBS domain-containing protein
MKVSSIIEHKGSEAFTISSHANLKAAANVMHDRCLRALVVLKDRKVFGVISEHDIVVALARHGQLAGTIHVSDMLSRQLVSIGTTDTIRRAMSVMTLGQVWHLPVINDGELMGIVSVGDIVKHCVEELESGM